MTGVPQRPSSPPARMGRDQEPVPGGRPGNRPARAIPAPEPVPRTLATPRHPGGLRPCARSTDHPPPPQPEAAPGTPTGPPSPSTPPPLTPIAPEPVPIPGPPHPPQPRTRGPAPDQLGQRLRSSDTTPEMPAAAAAAGPLHIPHPSLLFFKKAPGESASPAGRGYNHASEPEPRSRRRHPAPARPPRRPASPAGVSPAESAGQGAPPTSPAVRPAGPGPASASGARGSPRPAGLGRERRQQHTGQPGASPRHRGLAPGPCPGVGAGGSAAAPASEVPERREPGRPLSLLAQREAAGPGDGAPRAGNSAPTPGGRRGRGPGWGRARGRGRRAVREPGPRGTHCSRR